MKKVIALVLSLGVSALLFTACNEPATTTGGTVPTTTTAPVVTTTAGSDETTTAVTTTGQKVNVYSDVNMISSANYDYDCRIIRDENDEILGVGAYLWKTSAAKSDLIFDATYQHMDKTGVWHSFKVLTVGTGQGVVNFQSKVETIVIKDGIKAIGKSAFTNCTNLTAVSFPETLETIDRMAFWNCKSLRSLVIPQSVTTIEKNAFSDCISLESVTLPRRFESQVDEIFRGCSKVQFTFVD